MSVRQDMLALLHSRRKAFSLPGRFYGDPEFHKLDLDEIFYKDWMFAGHDCEIAEPGDFLTLQIGSYPVVVLRRHQRFPQFVQAPRLPHLHDRAWPRAPARLPVSPMVL